MSAARSIIPQSVVDSKCLRGEIDTKLDSELQQEQNSVSAGKTNSPLDGFAMRSKQKKTLAHRLLGRDGALTVRAAPSPPLALVRLWPHLWPSPQSWK